MPLKQQKKQLQEEIILTKQFAKQMGTKTMLSHIETIDKRVNNAGAVEQNLKSFYNAELRKLDIIWTKLETRRVHTLLLFRKFVLFYSLSFIPIFWIVYVTGDFVLKPKTPDPASFYAWLSIGVMCGTIAFIFYILYFYAFTYLTKYFSPNRNREIYLIKSFQVFHFTCTTLVIFTYILNPVAGWLYSLLSPFLILLMQGVINANIPSLIETGVVILSNILTVIGGWELLKKISPKKDTIARLRKDRTCKSAEKSLPQQ